MKLKYNVFENGDNSVTFSKDLEVYAIQRYNDSLFTNLDILNNFTLSSIQQIDDWQTSLEEGGNHHIVSLCITYDGVYEIKQNIKTLLKN